MLDIIENTIIQRLKEEFGEYEIDSFPVGFEEFTYTSPVGCILVRYEDSDMSRQNTVCAVMSDEEYNFTVFASIRYAQKHSDCYSFLTKLKTVLNGLLILSKRLIVSKVTFEAEINGDLWYTYPVKITLPLTDVYKDRSGAAELSRL